MAWQTNTETGRICSIAYAAENTAAPTTRPNTGSSMDWSDNATGGDAFGWTVAADKTTASAFRFTEDDFEFNDSDDGTHVVVKAPTATQKDAIIIDQPTVLDNVVLTSYEAGAKVMTLATNWSVASSKYTKGLHTTRRALIIEVEGLGMHYMPSVEIDAGTPGGGVQTLATQTVTIQVFRGSSVTSGYQWIQYADA